METLAYIHLVTTAESPEDVEPTLNPLDLRWLEQLNWKKLPSSAWIRLGAITISFALVSIASSSALALQRGNQGSQVFALQENLKMAGYYDGKITGFYGWATQAAVRRFQQAKGLSVDGIAGSKTLSVLYGTSSGDSNLATSILLRRGSRGIVVTQLQNTLKAKGFFNGPVTGYYGLLTEEAVRGFQRTKGIRADGIAGSNTLSALAGTSGGGSLPTGTELRPGHSRSAIAQLPNRLKAFTEAGLSQYQQHRSLTSNGIAQTNTFASLPPRA